MIKAVILLGIIISIVTFYIGIDRGIKYQLKQDEYLYKKCSPHIRVLE